MKEVIYRRYKKVLESEESLPNLIIVDGGKPQVHAALDSLKELNLDKVVPLIGLAKDDKHKTDRIIKYDMTEITLDKKSNLYFFLLNMQDEVHRFAISFHRNKRSKSLFENSLYKIKGLGKKNIDKLIEKYQTVEKIKAASVEELSQIIPKKIATLVKELK
ncbi:MAG: excinuclease ABC subunit C, partial [Malacoplasma sp.]|nr:excinuclease ABC subunit C [Malacoplasma sp.]